MQDYSSKFLLTFFQIKEITRAELGLGKDQELDMDNEDANDGHGNDEGKNWFYANFIMLQFNTKKNLEIFIKLQ